MADPILRPKDLRTLLVVYDGTSDAAALEPETYTFTAQAVPSYNPTVKAAKFVNGRGAATDSVVELSLENDLSPGISYSLAIAAFTGEPGGTFTFTAVSPSWPANRQFGLWDIVPTINKAEDTSEHLQRFILCIQDQLDTTLAAIDQWSDILDPDRAAEQWLDHMLRDLGNPFTFEDITEHEKRMLIRTLVYIYQLKGTTPGIEAAIRFFMGFESQVRIFRNSGSLLGKLGTIISKLDDSFVLGGGGPYDFALTVETLGPVGRALTAAEVKRIQRLVAVVKPAFARLWTPIFAGLRSTDRVQITGDAASVTVTWKQTATVPTNWRVYYRRLVPGVSPFNSSSYVQVAGAVTTATITTPIGDDAEGTTYYFALVPFYGGKEGFVSEVEVRNNLVAPTGLAATGGARKITVAWNPVAGATSYRLYRKATAPVTPVDASPVSTLIEVLGGVTSYTDVGLLPGQSASYAVTAMVGDSEGAYSASVTGTAA